MERVFQCFEPVFELSNVAIVSLRTIVSLLLFAFCLMTSLSVFYLVPYRSRLSRYMGVLLTPNWVYLSLDIHNPPSTFYKPNKMGIHKYTKSQPSSSRFCSDTLARDSGGVAQEGNPPLFSDSYIGYTRWTVVQ